MVFSKYDFGTSMNGLDVVRKSKKILDNEVPVFNMIATDIPKDDFMEAKREIGDKMNTIIRENSEKRYNEIIEDYNLRSYKIKGRYILNIRIIYLFSLL